MAKEVTEPLSPVVSEQQAKDISSKFGTPTYVYSQKILEEQAEKALNFPNEHGLTVRYAMKANPNANIMKIFDRKGIHIDASSGYECERAMKAGILPEKILLTSQEIPSNLAELIKKGVDYNACSLHQLENYGRLFPDSDVSVRINPGLGSGGTNRTNTGGPASSFGIWHEYFDDIISIAKKHNLNVKRIHTHIGSGSDPEVWKRVALMSLDNVERFLEAGHNIKILNLGGGYKVGRMSYEKSTDLEECGEPVRQAFVDFAEKTGKELKLEIEPGTFLVANAGCLIARVIDAVSTPKYNFIKIDSGMTEVTRPALYGAQHPIAVVHRYPRESVEKEYIVTGHCCESGDILTPAPGDSESLKPRRLMEAQINDFVVIGGVGAYCAGMSTKNYNSFPASAEVWIDKKGKTHLIRERQTLEQMLQNERVVV